MSAQNRSDIHRYLDEIFAEVAVTPELQDLKEELRSNLMARATELQASGVTPPAAAAAAIDELGDIREVIAEVESDAAGGTSHTGATSHAAGSSRVGGPGRSAHENIVAAMARNRVRPKPAFVVRTVLLALLAAAAITVVVLAGFGVIVWPLGVTLAIAIVGLALPIGIIVADSLQQETTQNYPLPRSRSMRFGVAALLGLVGLAPIGLFFGAPGRLDQPWLLILGIPFALVSLVLFVWLGVTKTNRTKQWALAYREQYTVGQDRFSQDPVAAARFGIYTVIIWVLAFAAFVVLSFTVGFAWSWIALLAGFALFFLVLARMLFPSENGAEAHTGAEHTTDAHTGGDAARKDHPHV